MKVDWLLTGKPRIAQIEALSRSLYGKKLRINAESDIDPQIIPNHVAKNWAHFLEMRIGKTPITLNEFMLLKRDGLVNRMLVISPNAFKAEWAREAVKFGLDVPIYFTKSGKYRELVKFIKENEEAVIIVNYEALVQPKMVDILMSFVGEKTFIAADESIKLANPQSTTFKNALTLSKECDYKRVLSGKPICQGPHQLWAQLRFIGLLNGFNYYSFRNRFCKMGGFRGKQIIGARNEEELNEKLQACSFLARRAEWLRTPGADYVIRGLDMPKEQREAYIGMEDDLMLELDNGSVVEVDVILSKFVKLQQISSGFVYDERRNAHLIVPHNKNPKLMNVKNLLEEEITGKLLVVAMFRHSIGVLQETLAEFHPQIIIGGMGGAVLDAVDTFNGDPKCRVLIGQGQSIKYGMTLVGNEDNPCHHIVYYENFYSLDTRSQSEQRPQGADQKEPITIIDYAASPLDMKVIQALQRKETVASAVLGYKHKYSPKMEKR